MTATRAGKWTIPEYDHAIESGTVSIVHLTEAHRASRSHPNRYQKLAAASYVDRLLDSFAEAQGQVVDSHFCCNIDAAALVVDHDRARRDGKGTAGTRLYVECDGATLAGVPARFEAALVGCREAAEEASHVLVHPANVRYCQIRAQTVAAYLLSGLDCLQLREDDDAAGCIDDLVARADWDLRVLGEKIEHLASWNAQYEYTRGMFRGLVLVLGLSIGIEGVVQSLDFPGLLPFAPAVALAAGALGAVLSVMIRLGRHNLPLNPVAEHSMLVRLGAYRPGVGAALGAGVTLLIYGGLLAVEPPGRASLLFIGAISLVSGFNERFAQATLTRASERLGGSAEQGDLALPAVTDLGPPNARRAEPAPDPPGAGDGRERVPLAGRIGLRQELGPASS